MFEALQHRTSIKGGAHTCYIDLSGIYAPCCPNLNESSALQPVKSKNVIEIAMKQCLISTWNCHMRIAIQLTSVQLAHAHPN